MITDAMYITYFLSLMVVFLGSVVAFSIKRDIFFLVLIQGFIIGILTIIFPYLVAGFS